ncbi:type III pantothenate kinase [Aliiglaciecola sp. M165]|uniref:type III pantothenate kinase n=1 Tax=Aliiglaciecola sp. M165 TaxID=2593649 RepID=UPI00117FDF44|nr:type III pantothenate kinase [Aliiglaciecola sp. M165]TRY32060.1 type III pantothenate kinase [Aliiglaciecola sp. M165]
MSERTSPLLVDIGNTRIKYAYAESNPLNISTLNCANIASLIPLLDDVPEVIVASVKNEGVVDQLKTLCDDRSIPLQHVTTEPQAFGIRCAYSEYKNLGVDRWLAVLGARLHTLGPVGVIDLGTAATFDLVIDAQHVGGWIAPGFALMKNAVTQNTSKVFGDDQLPESLSIGQGTAQCVNFGCQAMLEGFVLSAVRHLEQQSKDYRIFVCGGNANLVEHMFNERIEHMPDIVLQGLSRYCQK